MRTKITADHTKGTITEVFGIDINELIRNKMDSIKRYITSLDKLEDVKIELTDNERLAFCVAISANSVTVSKLVSLVTNVMYTKPSEVAEALYATSITDTDLVHMFMESTVNSGTLQMLSSLLD